MVLSESIAVVEPVSEGDIQGLASIKQAVLDVEIVELGAQVLETALHGLVVDLA